jgi:CheY-like chemotaxis protein
MAKEKIVVIDDSPIVRKLAELALEEEGYKVYTAEDGEEGLRICEEVRPAVILVDFIMPRMSGYQFCEAARDNELLKEIPIILITGKGEDVGKKFAEKFGVVDYFIKPFKSEVLVEKVNAIIYARKMQAGDVDAEAPLDGAAESADVFSELDIREKAMEGGISNIGAEPEPAVEIPGSLTTEKSYEQSPSAGTGIESVKSGAIRTEETPAPVFEAPGKPADTFTQPEEIFTQPVDSFGAAQDKTTGPGETADKSGYTFSRPGEMFSLSETSIDEGEKEVAAFPGSYEFEPVQEFNPAQAFDGSEDMPPEVRTDDVAGGTVDGVFRRYFTGELPYLIEKNIEDVLRRHGIIKDTSIVLSGDLADIPCVEALKLIDSRRLTGKFSAYTKSGSSEIYFENGAIVFALTSRQGKTLTSKRIAIIKKGSSGVAEDRSRDGILDAVLTTIEYKNGGFFFEKMAPPKALLELNHRSNVMGFILEGLRKKDEPPEVSTGICNSGIPVRTISDVSAYNIGLEADEAEVFSAIDGARKAADIGDVTGLDAAEVSKILCRFRKAGMAAEKGGL